MFEEIYHKNHTCKRARSRWVAQRHIYCKGKENSTQGEVIWETVMNCRIITVFLCNIITDTNNSVSLNGLRYVCVLMNIEEYREFCLSLGDDVEEKMPFQAFRYATNVLVFYVNGHMFSFCDIEQFGVITLKCQPERIDELKAQHAEIGKPFNLSPKYWIGIDALVADKELIEELTHNSYEIVKQKYAKGLKSQK